MKPYLVWNWKMGKWVLVGYCVPYLALLDSFFEDVVH